MADGSSCLTCGRPLGYPPGATWGVCWSCRETSVQRALAGGELSFTPLMDEVAFVHRRAYLLQTPTQPIALR